MTDSQDLPKLPRDDPDSTEGEQPLATASWLSTATVLEAIHAGAREYPRSPIILGQLWESETNKLFCTDDDRHLVTIAGSRAGKGRSLIIPNLLSYPGSVVCIDPKGENAAVTARYRHDVLKQDVVVLDPFAVLKDVKAVAEFRGHFNPFEWVNANDREAIDDVAALADAIIVRDGDKDPHWNESARAFLKGVMLTMMELFPAYGEDGSGELTIPNWTLGEIRKIASTGLPHPEEENSPPSLDGLLATMKSLDGFNGAISAAGHLIAQMGDNERGGVLSNLRRHTEFLESPSIAENVLVSDFNPRHISSTVSDPQTPSANDHSMKPLFRDNLIARNIRWNLQKN